MCKTKVSLCFLRECSDEVGRNTAGSEMTRDGQEGAQGAVIARGLDRWRGNAVFDLPATDCADEPWL